MAYRSSAIASSSTGGNLTATPVGVAAGDYLAMAFLEDTSITGLTFPSGFTQVSDVAGGPDGQEYRVSGKTNATGSEVFTATSTSSRQSALISAAWSGRDTTTGLTTSSATAWSGASATPITASAAGVTAAANDDVALFILGDQTSSTARWSSAAPSGYTQRQNAPAVDWVSLFALHTIDNVSAGATGSISSTLTLTSGAGQAGWAAVVLAIKNGFTVDNTAKPATLGQWDPELRLLAWW